MHEVVASPVLCRVRLTGILDAQRDVAIFWTGDFVARGELRGGDVEAVEVY